MSVLHMDLGEHSYDITVQRGALGRVGELMKLDRRVLILTDSGVPAQYSAAVAKACREPHVVTLAPGESNKCIEKYTEILKVMVDAGFDRGDCVVAVGGGVMGDLAGFVAATYMRGVDFYNIPTTLLSQIDSSIGGKVAVDFGGYKNIVGAFYQPYAVVIDPEVLKTLDERQFACGMAEAIKMFATFDADAFEYVEREGKNAEIDRVIMRALEIKRDIVEQDEKEKGLRRVLNFGHTVGHAIESLSENDETPLLHGECVAVGMLCMSEDEVRGRIAKAVAHFGLPTTWQGKESDVIAAMTHDKKASGDSINVVKVDKLGTFIGQKMTAREIAAQSREVITLI